MALADRMNSGGSQMGRRLAMIGEVAKSNGLAVLATTAVPITGTSYATAYDSSLNYEGRVLWLCPDPTNKHDRHAIKVLHDGKQIGWVGRRMNQPVADCLAGRQGYLVVRRHDHHLDDMQRMDGILCVPCEGGRAEPAMQTVPVKRCNGVTHTQEVRFWAQASVAGGPMRLDVYTDDSRSSVTIRGPDGAGVVWAYKKDLPASADELDWFLVRTADGREVQVVPKSASKVPVSSGPYGPSMRAIIDAYDGTNTYRFSSTVTDNPQTPKSEKETIMSLNEKVSYAVSSTISANKSAAAQAGYLTAGKIANNKFAELAAKSTPYFARGYVDTPLGKLVIANIAVLAAKQLRPNDATLAKLTEAMTVSAYSDLIANFDLEGMLNGLLATPEIKSALSKVADEGLGGGVGVTKI